MGYPRFYPGAEENRIDGRGGLNYIDGAPWRLVLHMTETVGLPRYSNPPHITIDPIAGTVWQHVPFNMGAYALRHPIGTPETNRQRALQVEIIGYSRNAHTLNESQPLSTMLHFFLEHWPIRRTDHPEFRGGACYGADSPCRMLWDEWAIFDGICGHQHVPGNSHWDPGLLDVDALLNLGDDDMPQFDDATAARLQKIADADATDLTQEGGPLRSRWLWALDAGVLSANSDPTDLMSKQEFAAFLGRYNDQQDTSASGINYGDSVILQQPQ